MPDVSSRRHGLPFWRQEPALAIVLLAFLGLGLIYSWATPVFESGDEISHYPVVKQIADGQGLPIQQPGVETTWRQEGSQPPLYYVMMALATRWIDTSDFAAVRQLNPHAKVTIADAQDKKNLVIHSPEREAFPWHGTVLAVYVIRFLSLLLAGVGVAFTYFTCLLAFPDRRRLAIGASALHAFNPMFLFTSASVSNDNLAITLAAAAFYLALRLLRSHSTGSWRELVGLGIVLGAGALTKLSASTILPVAAVALVITAWRRQDLGLIWRGASGIGGPIILLAGWWYVRNLALYGELTGMQMMAAIAGPRTPGEGVSQLLREWQGFRQTFWGAFGGFTVNPAPWLWTAGDVLSAAAGARLLLWLTACLRRGSGPGWKVTLMLLWVALTFAGVLRWTLMTPASLGRLLFPAISALAILMALGLAQISNAPVLLVRRMRGKAATSVGLLDLGGPALAASLAAIAATVAVADIHPVYVPTPPLTAAAEAAIPNSTDIIFGGRLALVGYELDRDEVVVGQTLRLTLYWRALTSLDQDYTEYVHLVDGKPEEKLGQQDSFPDGGRLGTRQLKPGVVSPDTRVIQVQRTPENGTEGQILVGLYDPTDGTRLAMTNGEGQRIDGRALASIGVLVPPCLPAGAVPGTADFAGLIELHGYRFDPPTLQPGAPGKVILFWSATRPLDKDLTLFAQLVDEDGKLVAQNDHQPQKGNLPTSKWRPGAWVVDAFEMKTPAGVLPGPYRLRIGWYDLATGVRLERVPGQGQPPSSEILLSGLSIAR